MNVLFVIFVCATSVLCHPVSDPEIPSKGVLKVVPREDASENDISLKLNEGAVVEEADKTAVASDTGKKAISNNLEEKGVIIIQDIVAKLENEMKLNEPSNADKSENISEKLLKTTEPEKIETITEKQNKNDSPEVPPYDYIADDYMFNNQKPSNVNANVDNPDESVFHIVPFGIEKSEAMPNTPKLDRNVNKLENEKMQIPLDQVETKIPEKEENIVEIPLNVQVPNDEDRYLPDFAIRDPILIDPSLSNPILSPYDTLPLNTSPESISVGSDKTVNPFSNQDAEFQNGEDNFIPGELDRDVTHDYDDVTYQDYNPNDNLAMNDNYDYDYQERNFPVPSYNQMATTMNSHHRNNRPFDHSVNMGHNHPTRSMSNPINEYKTIIYSDGPKVPSMPVNPPLKMSNDDISLIMKQIFPGIFKNGYSKNSKKEITLYIDGYPEYLTKDNKPILQNEKKLVEIPAYFKKNPQEFIMEIGNMKPMAEMNNNPLEMTRQDGYGMQSFGIKPLREEKNSQYIPEQDLNVGSNINEEITDQPTYDTEYDPSYYGYGNYAPLYHHALYTSPMEYSFHYPNRQNMPPLFYSGFSKPLMLNNGMGPQGNFPYRNRVPYHQEPMLESQMNMPYIYPTTPYDYNNHRRNYALRFYSPNQNYMNYNRFVPSSFGPYPVSPY